jgi:chemotaxis protein MotB
MKHSQGNLITTIIPILILASIAAAGWYYYYLEVEKNQSLTMENSSEQGILNNKLKTLQDKFETLQSSISNLLEDEKNLQVKIELQKKSQEELTASLEKTMAEKIAIETSLQQEVNRVALTTAELEEELDKRRAEQESLNNEIITVSGEKSQLLTRLEQEQESKKQIANLKSRLEQELNESRVEISQLKNQMMVINLTSEVLFSSGSAEIKPAGEKVLSIIADSLNADPQRAISVEGHTDNVPIGKKGLYESNWELSAARGLAAVNYFQQTNGVDPRRLRAVGYGEFHPVASNKTAEGRKRNRRIEIRMLPAETVDVVQN